VAVNLGGSAAALAGPIPELELIETVAQALRALQLSGWRVVPFAMTPADVQQLEALSGTLSLHEQVRRPSTAGALLELLGTCQLTLTMRLHGAVCSGCAGVLH
jgi:hypothetical protein